MHPVASRVIARIYATRLRNWSERVGVLGETQSGFRKGRSTADTTQMIIRIEEETQRVFRKTVPSLNRLGSTQLDKFKAYPRVSEPILWSLFWKLQVPEKTVKTVQDLHELNAYRIKGRGDLSDSCKRVKSATSPIMFTVYHAQAMADAGKKGERNRKHTEETWNVASREAG